jgi:hypothetical protein
MSDKTTWAILGDGVYIRIMVNTGHGNRLVPLRADDFEHTSKLTYQMITDKPRKEGSGEWDYYQLLSGFLTGQHEEQAFDRLVLVAPEPVLKSIREALPKEVSGVVIGELGEDLLAKSVDVIEKKLEDLITR